MVEVVIVLPVIMLVLLLGVQAAMWAVAAEVVQGAAATASERAAGLGGSSDAGVSAARAYLVAHGGQLISGPSVRVSSVSGLVDARVSAWALQIVPLLHLAVSAHRREPLQMFRGSG